MKAFAHGLIKAGHKVNFSDTMSSKVDMALFHSITEHLDIFKAYRAEGKLVAISDLGYLGYRSRDGYLRICINNWHPTDYFQLVKHPPDRYEALAKEYKLTIKEMRKSGEYVLFPAFSHKINSVYKLKDQVWDRWFINELKRHTTREIHYRLKYNHPKSFKSIKGSVWSDPNRKIEEVFEGAWIVATHHSNATIEGIMHGVPAMQYEGVASSLAVRDPSQIETPIYPTIDKVTQFLHDLAYAQWHIKEVNEGVCWKQMADEGIFQHKGDWSPKLGVKL
jgi:hypothetical protein